MPLIVYSEQTCDCCQGTGKVLTENWKRISETLKSAIRDVESKSAQRRDVHLLITSAADQVSAAETEKFIRCPNCEGKGKTYTPVPLTRAMVNDLLSDPTD